MNAQPQRTIFIIRHGEKPEVPPPYGVDVDGNQNEHSLLPRGWQRAGALATLFVPFSSELRAGLVTPTELICPDYGNSTATSVHRTYQTIEAVSERIGTGIESPESEGDEATLGQQLAAAAAGVTLVCWEHKAIHEIANNIVPVAPGAQIPQGWPDTRFDVIWAFTYDSGTSQYTFNQIPQMLLAGDTDSPIPV
jgi:hypothetical protein